MPSSELQLPERQAAKRPPTPAVHTAPVSAAPAVVLALQRSAGNAAVSRTLSRAPAASVETAGHQEPSWARPSTTMAAAPVHVATIHFPTKDSFVDAQDEEVLKGLAEAYATYARRNVGKPNEPQGVEGRIVGYADPRRSAGPDNQTLSQQRADYTARRLQRAFVSATHMIDGHFHFERIGGGVAPGAEELDRDAPAAEGNVLAPFRKAEIFLAGQASEPSAPAPKVADAPEDKRVKPPDLDNWNKKEWEQGDWGKFDEYIERGMKSEIEAMAMRIAGWTVSEGDNIDEILEWAPTTFALGLKDMPKIRFTKPPWWDNRGLALLPRLGRGGWTKPETLKYKARLLKRDYIETAKWAEIHFISKGSTFKLLVEEVKKDNPDRSKVDKYVLDLEYLRYMIDAIQNDASDVAKLTR